MATRAATFTAKIHTLSDYYFRTRHGILPLPSGIDVANTVKYFSQTLLGVLKDVPSIPVEMMRDKQQDHGRVALFPILDYKGLYHVVVQLVDVVPLIQLGVHALGQSLLHMMVCLVPFLEHHYIDTLPNLVATTLTTFPESLHQEIIDTLCNHLLPFCITDAVDLENESYATLSTSSILLTVFQYSKMASHHFQLLECLMGLKRDVVKDLFCVIAHGTSAARAPAAMLLFYYWPSLNPTQYDRRGIQNLTGWKPVACRRENCLSGENNEAIQMCLDPAIAIGTGDHPPPLYVCQGCSDQIRQETKSCHMVDILQPIQQMSVLCENKNCRSIEKVAICTCFSIECASYNGNRPTRYCSQCHSIRHNNRRGGDHVYHLPVENPWNMGAEMSNYVVEAIVSLLKEAQPIADKNYKETLDHHIRASLLDVDEHLDSNVLEERRMLSRYGIYLLVGLCAPTDRSPPETLGRLLAMLFQWFDATAYLQDDQAGGILERLKSEYVHTWLMGICKSHFEVFVSCLLPHPPDYARVGGHWDTVTSRTGRIKDGFNRLFCLVPYEVISLEVWGYIMGYWMEAIKNEVPENELPELKMLLSKVLDPEMSPLGFDAHQMYKFFSIRFCETKASVQEQALHWLQILCELDVIIPLSLVFSMFNDGIQSLCCSEEKIATADKLDGSSRLISSNGEDIRTTSPSSSDEPSAMLNSSKFKEEAELNLSCFVLMVDVLMKQMELQEVDPHHGLEHIVSREALSLIQEMIKAPWVGTHTCKEEGSFECFLCELSTTFYQLVVEVLEYVSPLPETSSFAKMTAEEMSAENGHSGKNVIHEDVHSKTEVSDRVIVDAPGFSAKETEGRQEKHEVEALGTLPLFTATVQTVVDAELQTVAIIPTEEVVRAVAHAITLSETDVGAAKVSIAQATVVDENEQQLSTCKEATMDDEGTFWSTSQGRFKFTLDELPVSLQVIYLLLKQELPKYEEPDVLYYIFSCLEVLCFNGECLTKAAKEHRGFLIWCQENLLIRNLWNRLQGESSHVARIAVQLLLHCLMLPCGADTFWKVVEEHFHNDDWKVRFSAVEKVTIISRFMEPNAVHRCPALQSSMANAFSYLISSMDDVSPYVSQRASLYLDTIQSTALKCLCWCLEVQFDLVIVDRPIIMQTLYQLYNCLPDRPILSWEFFLNRFDTLFLETQVTLERSGDIAYPRDLRNTNTASEVFTQKLNRVHEALNQSVGQGLRSLSVSLGPKLRYKRAMSAPGGMTCKQDKLVDKEKLFSRQSSAPVLKRKSSKFGVSYVHHPLATHFPNHLFPDGHLKEASVEDHSFLSIFHRYMEMEERDQDTVHLLVFLFMQFLSEPEHAYPTDEKAIAKIQNVVLRHLNLLLGFSPQDKVFCIPPAKMRASPIFNAFLCNLPRVLDRNFKMGTVLLPICVPLLLYCPAPFRSSAEATHPGYSLWCLDPRSRHSWLSAVCILLYKFRYDTPPLSKQVLSLVRIILNTLAFHSHRCRGPPCTTTTNAVNASHSREMSMVSAAELCNIQERDTPPYSPRMTMEGVIVTITAPVEGKVHYQKAATALPLSPAPLNDFESEQHWKSRKVAEFNLGGDDTEAELEAIPESPKSESPQADSLQDSVGELDNDSEPLFEKASIRVEGRGMLLDEQVVFVNPPVEVAMMAVVPDTQHGVEQKMAQQLQAFHCSFEKATYVNVDSSGECDTELKSDGGGPRVEDSDDIFVRQMTIHSDSVFIAKLVTNKETPKESQLLSTQVGVSALDVSGRRDKNELLLKSVPQTVNANAELSTKDGVLSGLPSNVGGVSHQNSFAASGFPLEVLDASRLEGCVLRREPAVVSQERRHLPSYLFQPIQSHPATVRETITSECSKASDEPMKVEARRASSMEKSELPECFSRSPLQHNMPWTIEIHSPINLECMLPPMPSPERLLPIGTVKSDVPLGRQCQTTVPTMSGKRGGVDGSNESQQRPLASFERTDVISGHRSGTQVGEDSSLLDKVLQAFVSLKPSINPLEHLDSVLTDNSSPILESVVVDESSGTGAKPCARTISGLAVNSVSDTTEGVIDLDLHLTRAVLVENEEGDGKLVMLNCHLAIESDRDNHRPANCKDLFWCAGRDDTLVRSPLEQKTPQPPSSVADNCLLTTDGLSIDQTVSDANNGGLQRLYPGSFRRMPASFYKPISSPCTSPRPITKTFDTLLETNYQAMMFQDEVGTDGNLDLLQKVVQAQKQEHDDNRGRSHFRQRRQRKTTGMPNMEPQKMGDIRNCGNKKSRKGDFNSSGIGPRATSQQQSFHRCAEEILMDRCPECGAALEQYSDEELGLCIVTLATSIHREPALIAPLLPEVLHAVSRIAMNTVYPWKMETNTYLPGNARSVARQFLRCVLHQLAPSGVFLQIFQSKIDDAEFFRTMALALADFNELNPTAPLQLLLEGLNEKKNLPCAGIMQTMMNMASYLDCLQLETSVAIWANILPLFDTFFRKLALVLPVAVDMSPTLRIICSILRIQGLNTFKAILEPFAKIVGFTIQSCSFDYQILIDLCHMCNRAFTKERDKLLLSRTVVFELVQALKFKTNIPDENLLKLVQFIIQDAGGTLGPTIIVEDIGVTSWDVQNLINTSASECMRQYFADVLDFVADVHTLSKIKSNFKGILAGLNEDTLGGALKAGVAQYLAIEITRGNNRENRAINRHLPWLYNPLPAVQQGPKEFIDCVTHIRLLSWLLLGSLVHMVLVGSNSNLICQPIPLEASCHVAEHVQVILAGFAEQSKASVLHMSSLFHAFILCQLWTMYCEQLSGLNMPGTEHYHSASLTLADFWAKVTPGILQLLSHSKVLAEMVTLHFLSLIEALIECNSTILAKLFPLWRPILCPYQNQLPGHLVVRLQACENRAPPVQTKDEAASVSNVLLKWVQRLQFKMGQIELQTSAATQFYSV